MKTTASDDRESAARAVNEPVENLIDGDSAALGDPDDDDVDDDDNDDDELIPGGGRPGGYGCSLR